MTTKELSHAGGGLISAATRHVTTLLRALVRRRRFKRLEDLDDHLLNDIGVTRAEVEIATRLPFTHDAGTELRRLSNERRRVEASRLRPLAPETETRLYNKTLGSRRWL